MGHQSKFLCNVFLLLLENIQSKPWQILESASFVMASERNTLRGAITFALWTRYEMQLPESPWRMAGVIVKQLELEGYVKPDE